MDDRVLVDTTDDGDNDIDPTDGKLAWDQLVIDYRARWAARKLEFDAEKRADWVAIRTRFDNWKRMKGVIRHG